MLKSVSELVLRVLGEFFKNLGILVCFKSLYRISLAQYLLAFK